MTLSTLGNLFSTDDIFKYFFLFFSANRIWHFMQIVTMPAAELVKKTVNVKENYKID